MSILRAITAPRIFDGNEWHTNAAVTFCDGKVQDIICSTALDPTLSVETLSSGFLAPGFVDLQVNGGGGVLLNNDPSVNGIETMCRAHAKFGTTSMLPTIVTDTPEIRDITLAAGIEAAKLGMPGFAGLHLEGPHLSIARKGAHDPSFIRPMTDDDVAALVAARAHLPALITTAAPENITPAQVRTLTQASIIVSIGHSDAGIAQVGPLIEAGATMATHLFNAMSQLTGREPGVVGTVLNSGRVNIGLIADGHHVHKTSIALALRAKAKPGRIFLVSDAMSTIGTDVTEFILNGRKITRSGGKLTLDDGTLAGADLELATAIKFMHQEIGIELDEAIRMATLYPAEAVGLTGVGSLMSGGNANMVWLSDELAPQKTWINGVN